MGATRLQGTRRQALPLPWGRPGSSRCAARPRGSRCVLRGAPGQVYETPLKLGEKPCTGISYKNYFAVGTLGPCGHEAESREEELTGELTIRGL